MAATTSSHPDTSTESYTYQRPSTAATRAVVDQTHEHSSNRPEKPLAPPQLQRRRTNNYEEALASRIGASSEQPSNQTAAHSNAIPPASASIASSTGTSQPTVVSGLAYRGDDLINSSAPSEGGVRPGVNLLGRQQSWKLSDQRRLAMERTLSSEKVGGYSSAADGSGGAGSQ